MKPTIALFIADPKCSVQSGNGIMKALGEHYNFKIFSKNELLNNFIFASDFLQDAKQMRMMEAEGS